MTPEHTALVARIMRDGVFVATEAIDAIRALAGEVELRDGDYMRCEKRAAALLKEAEALRAEIERLRSAIKDHNNDCHKREPERALELKPVVP